MIDSAPARVRLTVLVPCFNEEATLPLLHPRLVAALDGLDADVRVLYVDDGSADRTAALVDALASADPRVALLKLSRNFGKEIAMSAGLDHAEGDAVVIIDADLQDPPELVAALFAKFREGYDVVYAVRRSRAGESWLKRSTASAFYRVIGRLSRTPVPEDTGDFRLLSRRAVEALRRLPEQHRFMKGLFGWIGFRQIGVEYDRAPRAAGETKWNYWTLWNFAIEGITSFTSAPLRVATYVGLASAVFAFGYGIFVIIKTMLIGDPVAGYPSLMVVMLFLGGIQLMALGLIGEYLGRLYFEAKRRPLYLIDRYEAARADRPA
ncbi:MAG TPA: glycosyltransferase family 2 protein [Candidatus Saccharimonadia bacterium]|nr:glycosyltransferase family 2 protein [Candidatus Saccharimonadia bacterium]